MTNQEIINALNDCTTNQIIAWGAISQDAEVTEPGNGPGYSGDLTTLAREFDNKGEDDQKIIKLGVTVHVIILLSDNDD